MVYNQFNQFDHAYPGCVAMLASLPDILAMHGLSAKLSAKVGLHCNAKPHHAGTPGVCSFSDWCPAQLLWLIETSALQRPCVLGPNVISSVG